MVRMSFVFPELFLTYALRVFGPVECALVLRARFRTIDGAPYVKSLKKR